MRCTFEVLCNTYSRAATHVDGSHSKVQTLLLIECDEGMKAISNGFWWADNFVPPSQILAVWIYVGDRTPDLIQITPTNNQMER